MSPYPRLRPLKPAKGVRLSLKRGGLVAHKDTLLDRSGRKVARVRWAILFWHGRWRLMIHHVPRILPPRKRVR